MTLYAHIASFQSPTYIIMAMQIQITQMYNK